MAVDRFTLLFPVSLVTGNLPEVSVEINIPLSCPGSSVSQYLLRQSDLFGDLEGERATRFALIEAEQRLHQLVVEGHGSVADALL